MLVVVLFVLMDVESCCSYVILLESLKTSNSWGFPGFRATFVRNEEDVTKFQSSVAIQWTLRG